LRFADESAEFKAKRSQDFIERVIAGDPRGVLSEALRARLQFNHRILPDGPSYFDAICGGEKPSANLPRTQADAPAASASP
jgi:hypothetical protein